MSQTCGQQQFTFLEVAADWNEPIVLQHIVQPSIVCANGQLDPGRSLPAPSLQLATLGFHRVWWVASAKSELSSAEALLILAQCSVTAVCWVCNRAFSSREVSQSCAAFHCYQIIIGGVLCVHKEVWWSGIWVALTECRTDPVHSHFHPLLSCGIRQLQLLWE